MRRAHGQHLIGASRADEPRSFSSRCGSRETSVILLEAGEERERVCRMSRIEILICPPGHGPPVRTRLPRLRPSSRLQESCQTQGCSFRVFTLSGEQGSEIRAKLRRLKTRVRYSGGLSHLVTLKVLRRNIGYFE